MKNNFLLLAFSSLFSLFFLELALRIVHPPLIAGVGTVKTRKAKLYGWAPPPHHREVVRNPDTGKPHFFTTNAQGWKDVEHAFEKPESVMRILFIGDSNTWGIVPPGDEYARQAELLLKNKGYANVEVISVASGGWGTDQAFEALKHEGLKYKPDIVIYQFSRNDVLDNVSPNKNTADSDYRWSKTFKYELESGRLKKVLLKPKPSVPPPISLSETIKDFLLKSALIHNVNLVKNKLARKGGNQTVNWRGYSPVDPDTPYFPYAPGQENAALAKAWSLLEALMANMKQLCNRQNASFLVFSEEGDKGAEDFLAKRKYVVRENGNVFVIWNGKKRAADLRKPLKLLSKICRENKIPLIKPVRRYDRYDNDMHANSEGNKKMAEDIVDYLVRREILLHGN